MREISLRVPAVVVEDVLDRLLPMVPTGVRETRAGDQIELRMRGRELPPLSDIQAMVRRWGAVPSEREVSDDWRRRRLDDYEVEVIGGRLVVRPDWAPPALDGLIDIALADDVAFGSGAHPSTRSVLTALLEVEPLGAFADLGCGSGVVGILASKLGWAPVVGVEILEASAASARANVARNGAQMEVAVADLIRDQPPEMAGFVANVHAAVHEAVARSPVLSAAQWGVLSGFGPQHEPAVLAAYAQAGLDAAEIQHVTGGWSVIELRRG
jgi:ribosomal protein L11 methyltransferase